MSKDTNKKTIGTLVRRRWDARLFYSPIRWNCPPDALEIPENRRDFIQVSDTGWRGTGNGLTTQNFQDWGWDVPDWPGEFTEQF